MDEDVKARLRLAAAEKRKREPKAKDYELAEWLVMADKVRDDAPEICDPSADYFDPQKKNWGRSLRYVPEEVIEALARLMPAVRVRYQAGPNRVRTTWILPSDFIVHLLDELALPLKRYATPWNARSIERCRMGAEEYGPPAERLP